MLGFFYFFWMDRPYFDHKVLGKYLLPPPPLGGCSFPDGGLDGGEGGALSAAP